MNKQQNLLTTFFSAPIKAETYLNLLYLLLAFPLGLTYFIFFTAGFAAGVPLIIIFVGFLILAVMFAASWGLTAFERQMAIALLRVDIAPMNSGIDPQAGFWKKLGGFFSNPVTWKGLLLLLLKFPVGLLSFIISITTLAVTFSLLAAPVTYRIWPYTIGFWQIDTFFESILAFLLGGLSIFLTLNILNLFAWLCGQFARIMLGQVSKETKEKINNSEIDTINTDIESAENPLEVLPETSENAVEEMEPSEGTEIIEETVAEIEEGEEDKTEE